MRKLEKQEADKWTGTKNTAKEIPFVRAAKSGGWKDSLPRPLGGTDRGGLVPADEFSGLSTAESRIGQQSHAGVGKGRDNHCRAFLLQSNPPQAKDPGVSAGIEETSLGRGRGDLRNWRQ